MPQIPLTLRLGLKCQPPLAIHQQGPQMGRAVVSAVLMLVPNLVQHFTIEDAVIGTKENLACYFSQLLPEPAVQRNGKSLLATLEDIARNLRFDGFLENVFAGAPLQFQKGRYRRRSLHQLLIKQGRADLERYSHARSVHLREDV